jgi:methylthioribulose-1-phosphate dehydratase
MVRPEGHVTTSSSRRPKRGEPGKAARVRDLATELAEIGRDFYHRGWVLGTSGNFSALVSSHPLRLAITATGLDKGTLIPAHVVEIDEATRVIRGKGQPSNESRIHIAIVRARGAGAVLHTHSLWSTIASEALSPGGGVSLEGFEMLKGLEGVRTHEHREWLPIVENSQDTARMAQAVEAILKDHPAAHGFLIKRHGLYTWGQDLAEAKRHVEILEFLLEVVGRVRTQAC